MVDMTDLAADIMTKTRQEIDNGTIVVSTCLEIAAPTRGATLEINRVIGNDGEIIGLGPRPGHEDLVTQIESISRRANGRPIAIVEDGTFTGATLCTVLELFERVRARVEAIVLGFAFPKAIDALKARVNGSVHTIEVTSHSQLLDWMPDHDFMPLIPNCGRTFGSTVSGRIQPYYTSEGWSYAAPYIYPFGRPAEWASIPEAAALRFSVECLNLTRDFFSEISHLNGGLTVGQLTKSWARVSIPYYVGEQYFPTKPTQSVAQCFSDAMGFLHEQS